MTDNSIGEEPQIMGLQDKVLLIKALGLIVEMRSQLMSLREQIKPFDLHWTTDRAKVFIEEMRTYL